MNSWLPENKIQHEGSICCHSSESNPGRATEKETFRAHKDFIFIEKIALVFPLTLHKRASLPDFVKFISKTKSR